MIKLQDEFENFMDLRARELRGDWFDAKVAGITMRNLDGSSRQDIARTLRQFDQLQLVPEPDNLWDPNAVLLLTPAGQILGYLEARLAEEHTRQAARGGVAQAFVRAIRQRGTTCGVSFGLATSRPRPARSQE